KRRTSRGSPWSTFRDGRSSSGPGRSGLGGCRFVALGLDGHGRLALAGAEVVKPRAHRHGLTLDLDLLDVRRVHGEHAFDTLAVADAANGEGLMNTMPLARDHDAGEHLDTLLVAFAHLGVHTHAVANLEVGQVLFQLRGSDLVDDGIHGGLFLK